MDPLCLHDVEGLENGAAVPTQREERHDGRPAPGLGIDKR
jgi:hypothetical protein